MVISRPFIQPSVAIRWIGALFLWVLLGWANFAASRSPMGVPALWLPPILVLALWLGAGNRSMPALLAGVVLLYALLLVGGGQSPPFASMVALLLLGGGAALQMRLGSQLVARWLPKQELGSIQTPLHLWLVAMPLGAVGAAAGTLALFLVGRLLMSDLAGSLFIWWGAEVLGALLLLPWLASWRQPSGQPPQQRLLSWGVALLLCGVGTLLFSGWAARSWLLVVPLRYLFMALLLWAAFWLPLRVITSLNLALGVVLLWQGVRGAGPLAPAPTGADIVTVQSLVGLMALTTLGVAAALGEQRRLGMALHSARDAQAEHITQRLRSLRRANLMLRQELTEQRQAGSARDQEVAFFRAIVESSFEAYSVVGADGGLRYLGPGVYDVLGYVAEEREGKPFYDILHPDDVGLVVENFERMIGEGLHSLRHLEVRIRHKDGSWRLLECSATNMLGNPAVGGIVATFRDVTRRRRVELSLQRTSIFAENLLTSMRDGLLVLDAERVIVDVNPAFCRMTGFERGELVGCAPPYPYWGLGESSALEQGFRAFLGGARQVEMNFRRKDGSWLPVMLAPSIIRDAAGNVQSYFATVKDMTEQRHAERELLRRLAEMEAVNQVSSSLRAATTLEQMLPNLMDTTLAALGCYTGSIWLCDRPSNLLHQRVRRGWTRELLEPPMPIAQGIVGHVFTAGVPYVTDEYQNDSHTRDSTRPRLDSGWGGACVPIRTADHIVGVLCVSVRLPRVLQEHEVSLLVTLAEIAGNAIHRTQLYEETRRQLRRLASLHAIDRAITTNVHLGETLAIFVREVAAQLEVQTVAVRLVEQGEPTMPIVASQGFSGRGYVAAPVRWGEGLVGQVAAQGEPLHLTDLEPLSASPDLARLRADERLSAYLVLPLVAKGVTVGVLEVGCQGSFNPAPEWMNFLYTLAGQGAVAIENATLLRHLEERNRALELAYDTTLEGWSRALELRDHETQGHSQRVTTMTMRLAELLGLEGEALQHIRRGALLHDIGKMGIPDHILHKDGPLTPDEWEIMRQHPTYAYQLLAPIAFLRPALDIPYAHHERWDGSGYPRALRGEAIPLSARLFAVVDVWDALASDRPYRAAWPPARIIAYLREQADRHFDPEIVELFLALVAQGWATTPSRPDCASG